MCGSTPVEENDFPVRLHYNHFYKQLIIVIIIIIIIIYAWLRFLNGTVQWSAWMTHTRLHPPTIEVRRSLLIFSKIVSNILHFFFNS